MLMIGPSGKLIETNVVGYTFNGAAYCTHHAPSAADTRCECGRTDEFGACTSNCHGYGPHPIFIWDEGWEDNVCDVPHGQRKNGSPVFETLGEIAGIR